MEKSAGGMPDAPPAYDDVTATGCQQPYPGAPQGAGGFVPGPPPPDQNKGMNPGYPPQGYPPQGPPMMGVPTQQAGQPGPAQQVVVVVSAPNYGPHPIDMMCPHCQCQIRTSTESEPGVMAWILAGVLCVVGLWPCACIPCCIESLNTVTHKCPSCKHFLGRYKGGL